MSAKLMPENATSIATSSSPGDAGARSRSLRVDAAPNFSITISRCMPVSFTVIESSNFKRAAQPREAVGVDRARELLALALGGDEARVGQLLDVVGHRRRAD